MLLAFLLWNDSGFALRKPPIRGGDCHDCDSPRKVSLQTSEDIALLRARINQQLVTNSLRDRDSPALLLSCNLEKQEPRKSKPRAPREVFAPHLNRPKKPHGSVAHAEAFQFDAKAWGAVEPARQAKRMFYFELNEGYKYEVDFSNSVFYRGPSGAFSFHGFPGYFRGNNGIHGMFILIPRNEADAGDPYRFLHDPKGPLDCKELLALAGAAYTPERMRTFSDRAVNNAKAFLRFITSVVNGEIEPVIIHAPSGHIGIRG